MAVLFSIQYSKFRQLLAPYAVVGKRSNDEMDQDSGMKICHTFNLKMFDKEFLTKRDTK